MKISTALGNKSLRRAIIKEAKKLKSKITTATANPINLLVSKKSK